MTTSSPTRWLPIVLLATLVAGCGGNQGATPPPAPAPAPKAAPTPAPTPKVIGQDTATPTAAPTPEEVAAQKRREYFKHIEEHGTAPAPAPAPAPSAAPKPTVAPAPKAAPKPSPRIATTHRPRHRVPMPKPITRPPKGTSAPGVAATEPASSTTAAPAPGGTATTGEAVAAVAPQPTPPPGTAEAIPMAPAQDPVRRCGEPADLQEAATRGALSNADLTCLNEAYNLAPTRLAKERVSVMLLTNAYAAGDKTAEEDLLKRHLTQVDPANPEMAYRYALILVQKGPGQAAQVVHWASVGLTNRAGWTGDTYKQRVYALYKLRAAASDEILTKAQAAYKAEPSDPTKSALTEAREDTKRYARDWYTFAKATDQASKAALDLCLIASQSADWCMQGS